MLEVRLLGQFDIRLDGQPIVLAARRAQLLFAYLIMNAGIAHRREKVAGLLWSESSDANARLSLRQALWQIRRALNLPASDSHYLVTDDISITFQATAAYRLDVEVINRKVSAQATADDLIDLVSNYGGELLPGFYDEWVSLERERVQAGFEQKMKLLLDRLAADQRWEDALEWGERWIALGHVPERAYRALMIAHSGLGDTAAMAATFQRCVEALRRELNVEPSDQTWATYERLSKERQPRTRSSELPGGSTGPLEAELKPAAPTHNLPAQPTRLIGRVADQQELNRQLQDPTCRLITLIGPGGTGKTRLALEVAANQVDHFGDGVYFVPLVSVATAEALTAAIASSLRFAFFGASNQGQQLVHQLRDKQILLVLDNFEHLLNQADLIDDILTEAAGVKIIVTSRQRLNLQWEWLHEVGGLDYPTDSATAALADFSAVQLFVECARRVQAQLSLAADRDAIVRLCQLLDGSPLGIELAAAWLRILPCQDIVQKIEVNLDILATALTGVPERQRSLRATFEYSWQLLSDQQREVFKRLAVLRGGFQREAAELVAGASVAVLAELMDKSFIRRSVWGRYELHEIMRQYATEKLLESSAETSAAVHTRQAQYYLSYARQHQHDYIELEHEWSNLAAGMQAAYDQQLWTTVIDYATTLTEAWFARGRYADARRGYQRSHAAAQALSDQPARATSLYHWAQACIEQSDYDEANEHLAASLELYGQSNDQSGIANVQSALARIATEHARYAEAEQLLATCQSIREQLGDVAGIAEALQDLARTQYYLSNFEVAEALSLRALAMQQTTGNHSASLSSIRLLADIALHGRNALDAAEQYCRQAQTLSEDIGNQAELASTRYTLSEIYRRRGDLPRARENADSSLACFKIVGDRKSQAKALFRLSLVDADRKDYSTALTEGLESLDLCRRVQDQVGVMYVLRHLGDVFGELSQPHHSVEIWTEALTIAEALKHPASESLRERLGSATSRP